MIAYEGASPASAVSMRGRSLSIRVGASALHSQCWYATTKNGTFEVWLRPPHQPRFRRGGHPPSPVAARDGGRFDGGWPSAWLPEWFPEGFPSATIIDRECPIAQQGHPSQVPSASAPRFRKASDRCMGRVPQTSSRMFGGALDRHGTSPDTLASRQELGVSARGPDKAPQCRQAIGAPASVPAHDFG
jgi:hypothetical protein